MDEKLPWRSAIHFVTVYSWQVHFSPHKSSHQGNNPAEKNSTAPHPRRPVSHINSFFFWVWTSEVQRVIEPRTHPSSSTVVTRSPSSYVAVRLLSLYTSSVCPGQRCVCVQMFILVLSPWLPQKVLDKIRGAERSIPQRSGADINRDNPARPTHQQRATSVNRRSTYYYYKQSSVELHQDSERTKKPNQQTTPENKG